MVPDNAVEDILMRYTAIRLESPTTGAPCFVGNVHREGSWYRVVISCPKFPSLQGMQLCLHQGLRFENFTEGSAGVQPDWSLADLIAQLPQLMPPVQPEPEELPTLSSRSKLYAEIAQLQSSYPCTLHINEACMLIRFSKFEQFNEHYLEVILPTLQILEHSLPDCEAISWSEFFSKNTTLSALLEQFLKCLEDLQEFYAQFTEFDELCYVVQPEEPSSKHNWRLFLLRERVFLKVSIADPFAPTTSMSLHIFGPTYEVEQLRRCYSDGLKDWDSELNIHSNLLRIFDLCFFPMPPGSGGAERQPVAAAQFCNICYCHQLHGQVPIVSCDNRSCTLIYHASCLLEWFNVLSDGKTFLDVSIGACPSCKAKLSTSFTELLTN